MCVVPVTALGRSDSFILRVLTAGGHLRTVVLAEGAVGAGDGERLPEAAPLQQPGHPVVPVPRPPHHHVLQPKI